MCEVESYLKDGKLYMEKVSNQLNSIKAVIIYLILTLGTCFLFGFFALVMPNKAGYSIFNFFSKIFTLIPVLAALCTRLILKDKSSWNIDIRVWRNKKALLLSAFLPGLAVLFGATIYYLIFPRSLSANIQSLLDFCAQYGLPVGIPVNGGVIVFIAVSLWLISVFAIPIHFLELGEEIGWRGYLLPKMLSFMNEKKSILVNGVLWGIAHMPLIFFGFNYGFDYWGAPITGILLMVLFCICSGICLSFSMIKTNNCMYAAIIHGAINVAADIQIISIAVNRPLIGPTPTGIIGMSIFVVVSAFIFFVKLKIATK
jgi:uncharacterized protein